MADTFTPGMIIGGKNIHPERETRTYTSPGTGDVATEILLGTGEDVQAAVDAARAAAPTMAAIPLDERVDRCEASARSIEENAGRLADILTRVHGKPRHTEAIEEVKGAAVAFRQAAAAARWMPESHVPLSREGKRLMTVRRPRGTYAIFTPWNFPIGLACIYYLGPGLATGNSIVWLGAPSTTATHEALAEVVLPHWPEGAINLLTGLGPEVGQELAKHPGIDAVGFTGSTQGGYAVAGTAIGKPIALELGGNGPTIVLADADVERAADCIATGSFSNAGQICTSTGRVLAHASIATSLAEALAQRAEKLVVDDPFNEGTTMGPVHLEDLADRVMEQIEAAKGEGATVLTGGERIDGATRQYLRPSVVDRVDPKSTLHVDETFGPVAPIVHFDTEESLRELVGASPFGLHAGVFSSDIERAIGLSETLRVGHVNINDTSAYWEWSIPAGGAAGTTSGMGRTGGPASVEEMTEVFSMTIESRPAFG